MRGEVCGPGGGRAWGGGGASGMHGKGLTQGLGARARAERTLNMAYMSVTLEVSQLSGWLNLYACCRVERRACNAGRGVRAGRWEVVGRRRRKRACTGERPTQGLGARARAERTLNM